jgi:hypothetical protein
MIEILEKVSILACGIVVAWIAISAIAAYIELRRETNRRKRILWIDRVRELKGKGYSHKDAVDMANQEFHR